MPQVDVLDLSVHNEVRDLHATRASGVRGIIHKATEGVGFVDRKYAERRKMAKDAGLLWGAYHFANNSPVAAQVEHFLRVADPDENTLLCLDLEDNKRASGNYTMSFDQAKEFCQLVFEKTGQRPVIYSGNLLKEYLRGRPDAFIARHRLWLAQYSARAVLPPGFKSYWLWQFSGDGWGGYGTIPGIPTRGIDVNVFGGVDLEKEWALNERAPPAPVPAPEPEKPAEVPVVMAVPEERIVIPATDGPAGYDPATVQKASLVKTVATSKTAWANIGAVLMVILGAIADAVNALLTALQDVVKDVGENLSSVETMVGWFRGNWQHYAFYATLACLAVAFVRHVDLKRIFNALTEGSQEPPK